MDSRKHHHHHAVSSDQVLSTRGKVVSGWFSFGVGATLLVLTVLLLSNSLKSPVVTPLFEGFNSNTVNPTVVSSWPLSFSSTTSSCFASNCTNGTIEANVSRVDNGEGVVLEKTHLGNLTDNIVKNGNGSFSVEQERIQQITHEANGSVVAVDKIGNFENTHLGNVSQVVKNESLFGEGNVKAKDTVEVKSFENGSDGNANVAVKNSIEGNVKAKDTIEVKSFENSSDGNANVTENNNVGNLSMNGEFGRSPGGEERAIEANDGGDLAEKNKTTISNYDSQLMKRHDGSSLENCDIFDGRWVRDNSKPYYPAGSCPYIDRDFDCNLNGRPDDGFVKWKWQPNGCDIPSLNATDFLERLRGKKLVFVGDSLNRNMWESLVCILRHSVRKKKRVYEISGRREFKKKGFYAFRFEDYNCSVDFVGAPFLVRESTFNGRNGSFETLRLDLMDQTTSMYQDADVIVFNTGHWWTHEKTSRGEDYYQEGNHVYPRLKVLEAYKRALTTWARWIDKNIVSNRTQVFFRGYSVTHFKGGQWNSGGQCHKETEPIFNETYLAKYPSKMRALEYVLKKIKTPLTYLNISRLTDFRKDGHPSIYRMKYKTQEERIAAERSQDCSHWCLPGVPDTWNELLYASLLKAGRGSWGN